jgi:hypothetical protein
VFNFTKDRDVAVCRRKKKHHKRSIEHTRTYTPYTYHRPLFLTTLPPGQSFAGPHLFSKGKKTREQAVRDVGVSQDEGPIIGKVSRPIRHIIFNHG